MNKIMNGKLVIVLILCLAYAVNLEAQKTKIKFQKLTWEEAMKKAEKEKKFIFVDAYRPSCESCDKAITEVFTVDSIATLYNKHFVSIRINMHTEAGKAFAPKLQMLMYPAYIFFSADGEQLGSSNSHNFVQDHGQAMYQAHLAITQGNNRLNNSRSILFEEISWEAVLAKSKKENKPIFIDAYTTWCRPCIQMDRNVFTLDNVADFYNENFINVKLNAEKGEGIDIRKKFEIKAYPTYLYLDTNGELVSRTSGYTEAKEFIDYGKNALKAFTNKNAEGKGIQFQQGTWKDILKKSRVENKLIFFDGYTTWCGPCKTMAKDVFTNDTIADFFNENFINVKFDMEKGEGIDLKKHYKVAAYPTYIYIDGNGNEIHRTVGSTSVEQFAKYGEDALSEDRTLSYLKKQYESGNREAALVTAYLSALKVAYNRKEVSNVAVEFLDGLKGKQLLTEGNWLIIKDYLSDAESKSFAYLVNNRKKFYQLYDKKEVDDKIYNTYLNTVHKYVTYNDDKTVNFDEDGFNKYLKSVNKSGVDRKERIIAYSTVNNLASRREWARYAEEIDKGLANGNIEKSPLILYNYALTIKRVEESPEILSKAAHWAKLGGDVEPNKDYVARYYNLQADLLVKAGKTDEAAAARSTFKPEELEKANKMNPMKALIIKKK
ncbi:DUF255 domain-containing protein [Fulvivirga sp. M361]|uniref:thioredoxin family protein n=1 Tax=Fulvivirga sp. M361 TaxID=2594266 RepID=UPI00117B7154|nr:thioredoxin family protein [Fulvivirga sp. M361]TRX60184.1 DUF255 domain-containing protein [Fulvivirga sp. M361]